MSVAVALAPTFFFIYESDKNPVLLQLGYWVPIQLGGICEHIFYRSHFTYSTGTEPPTLTLEYSVLNRC